MEKKKQNNKKNQYNNKMQKRLKEKDYNGKHFQNNKNFIGHHKIHIKHLVYFLIKIVNL